MKKILVTGSEGYIGAVLVSKLIDKGYEVIGLDTCFYGDGFGLGKPNYQLIQKDIRDINDLDFSKYDAIIHLAALSNDPTGEFLPSLTKEINYKATIALAKKAKEQGVKRFLFASSCSIYGVADGVVDEESSVNPITEYAKSKIASENDLKKLADDKFCVAILRNSTVYGYSPKLRNDLVVNNFVTCALATKKIKITSDGTPWRPIIDINDLSKIFIKFLEVDAKLVNGKVFNIGFNENNLQVKDILTTIQTLLSDCEVIYTGESSKDSRSYRVKFDRLAHLFPDLKQERTLAKSVADLIAQLKKNHFSPSDFYSQKFTRLATLKKLLKNKKLNPYFYWV